MDIISIFALVIGLVAAWKLKSVLGQRTEEDSRRVDRMRARERQAGTQGGDVVAMPRREPDVPAATHQPEVSAEVKQASMRAYPGLDPRATEGLVKIVGADPAFDPADFLAGAGRAYEMIVCAFADGDRKTLRRLLNDNVYDAFEMVIADREKTGDVIEQQFVGIKKADIVEADLLKGGVASVTVKFVSELISARKDEAGNVIEGDSQRIREVTDNWTFVRDISTARARSRLDWLLDATQEPN